MQTLSLEHVRLSNRLRAVRRDAFLAAAEELDRLRAAGGVELEPAAELLILFAVAHIALQARAINHERLVAYLVNGLSLDGPGLPGPLGPVSAGDQAFVRLSAQIDEAARAWLGPRAHAPGAAGLARQVAALRSRYRLRAWALTHPTWAPN